MAIVEFSIIYSELVLKDIHKTKLQAYPYYTQVPEKYRKKSICQEDGFVKLFCE